MPKVSVIIPTYNGACYICEAIDSVLAQTYQDFEIIVIDDGSSDNTKDVLKKNGSKIKYIFQENKGVSAARNVGIKEAAGEYIALLDADDIWLPDKIALQVDFLEKNSAYGLIYSDAYIFDEKKILEKTLLQISGFWQGDVLEKLILKNFIPNLTVLVRRVCFDKIGLFDETLKYGEDHDRWLRIASISKIGCINKPLAKYRIHDLNASHKIKQSYVDRIKLIGCFFQTLERPTLKLKMLKNARLGKCYFGLGKEFFWEKNRFKAIQYFVLSFFYAPFNPLNLLYIFVSLLIPYFILFSYKKTKKSIYFCNGEFTPAEEMFLH